MQSDPRPQIEPPKAEFDGASKSGKKLTDDARRRHSHPTFSIANERMDEIYSNIITQAMLTSHSDTAKTAKQNKTTIIKKKQKKNNHKKNTKAAHNIQ